MKLRLEVGGIDKQKFDELAAPIEAKHSAPWLRRRGTEVHVVDLEKRVERKPTDEELTTGIFANTHDEYLREQTTLPAVAGFCCPLTTIAEPVAAAALHFRCCIAAKWSLLDRQQTKIDFNPQCFVR